MVLFLHGEQGHQNAEAVTLIRMIIGVSGCFRSHFACFDCNVKGWIWISEHFSTLISLHSKPCLYHRMILLFCECSMLAKCCVEPSAFHHGLPVFLRVMEERSKVSDVLQMWFGFKSKFSPKLSLPLPPLPQQLYRDTESTCCFLKGQIACLSVSTCWCLLPWFNQEAQQRPGQSSSLPQQIPIHRSPSLHSF